MINAILGVGSRLKGPSIHELRGSIYKGNVKKVKGMLEKYQVRLGLDTL